jgi:hypothetical protein
MNCQPLVRRIGIELRTQYMLGYSPSNAARDGKYHRVKVTLADPETMSPLRVFHRMGYYAPARWTTVGSTKGPASDTAITYLPPVTPPPQR